MKKNTGLWIGKTGNGNAWYHIYPFLLSKYNSRLHIVRYELPQRSIEHKKSKLHIFNSNGIVSEIYNYFLTGFRVLRENKVDYIVSFNLVPWASFAWILAKLFRKPIIIGLIGTDFNSYVLNRNNLFIKYILRNTDVITVTGSKMKRYFNKDYNNVFVYPHCLPDSWFDFNQNEEMKKYDLISISALTKNKRTIDIIRALSILKDRDLNLKLIILGDGKELDTLLREVKYKNLEDNVSFLGYRDNVKKYLEESKIFIQASIKEGLSLSLIEAIGLEVIPIITNAGSEKDIVSHDHDCLFFKKNNPNDLANKIEYALLNNNYSRLKKNILVTKQRFKLENAVLATEKIQKYLIDK